MPSDYRQGRVGRGTNNLRIVRHGRPGHGCKSSTYRPYDGQGLAKEDNITPSKNVAEIARNRERHGICHGPSTDDPGNVRGIAQSCTQLRYDTTDERNG